MAVTTSVSVLFAAFALAACLGLALSLLSIARSFPQPVCATYRHWSLALALGPLGWLAFEAADLLHSPWLFIPAKTLVCASFVEMLRALRRLDGEDAPAYYWHLPSAFVAAATTVYVWRFADVPMRTFLLSAILIGLSVAAAMLANRVSERLRSRYGWIVVVAMIVAASAVLLRSVVLAKVAGSTHPAVGDLSLSTLLFGVALLAPAIGTLGLVLVANDGLLRQQARQADIDGLTGLLNRRALLRDSAELLEQTRLRGGELCVLVIDVDRFKHVNDQYGHALGDRALCLIVEAISRHLREGDLFGRCGGDEFVVCIAADGHRDHGDIAERLRAAVDDIGLFVDGERVALTISVGSSRYPHSGNQIEVLIRHADAAMYDAKHAGRNTSRRHGQGAPGGVVTSIGAARRQRHGRGTDGAD